MRRTSLAAIALLFVLGSACGNDTDVTAGSSKPAEGASSPNPCEERWDEVRREAREDGLRDGEARRRADEARLECEGVPLPGPEPEQARDCRSGPRPIQSLSDLPRTEGDPVIFLTCEREVTELGLPVYGFERPVTGDSAAAHLQELVASYFEGPTEAERSAGFGTALGNGRSELLLGVTLDGSDALVNFADELLAVPEFGASTFDARIIAELAATVLQFATVDSVQFAVNDSCQSFWERAAGAPICRDPLTRAPDQGDIGS